MALIDVNEVLADADLATTFNVRRHNESVSMATGRTVITPDEVFENIVGVITWKDGPIVQGADATITAQQINVATSFSLRDASFGYAPDTIIWQGVEYRVTSTKSHRHLGRGWTRASAESIRATDQPAPDGSTA